MNLVEGFNHYGRAITRMYPTFIAKSVLGITPAWCEREGVWSIVYDLDGTLVDHNAQDVSEGMVDHIAMLRRFNICQSIVTNVPEGTRSERAGRLAANLGIAIAIKPSEVDGRTKPYPDGIELAIRIMNRPPSTTLVVGDQLFKDIAAGNRVPDVRTMHVARVGDNDHPKVAQFQRPMEAAYRSITMGMPVSTDNYPWEPRRVFEASSEDYVANNMIPEI